MKDFIFHNPTKIIFGKGAHTLCGEHCLPYGKKVLLHYGGGSIKRNGVYEDIVKSLGDAGIEAVELGGVQPNPRLSLVYEGIRICRNEGIGFILAAGGGSVIDSAKAIAMGVHYQGDVWDFFGGNRKPESALSIGVVLTIPAAGSESSDGTVITKEEGALKRSCVSSLLYPRFAILNPELCKTLPRDQIAAGGTDILAHVMERYFSGEPHTDLSDRLCESVMRSVMDNLLRVAKNPEDENAWPEVMWGGTLAHNGLIGKGRQEDWASHAIEHELSALYDIAHGAGLAIVFPAWMKYVCHAHLSRFVQFAVRVMDVDGPFDDQEAMALEGIARLERFLSRLGAPVSLHQAGIGTEDFQVMAEKACGNGTIGSFLPLGAHDVEAIFNLAK